MFETFVAGIGWGVTGIICIIIGFGLIVAAAGMTFSMVNETLTWVRHYARTSDERVVACFERARENGKKRAQGFRAEKQNKIQEDKDATEKRTNL